ncbi:hypothetical protein GCM10009808_19270 [Microbacterium sediminicola]|uniref:Alpha/beta hydrolase fold n=1 Tax=Microbacterium sediminicola TaxID=415210 RepID=A0ABP4UD22_9MICO
MYTSDIELFFAEDVAYADRLRESGVAVTLDVVHGVPHGVESWSPGSDIARSLLVRSRAWLAGALT